MRFIGLTLCFITMFWLASPDAYAEASSSPPAPGFSVGLCYAADDDLNNLGWNVAGTLEGLVGDIVELRGTIGYIDLRDTIQGQQVEATYAFLLADVLAADLVSPTGGIGLYYLDLGAPSTDQAQRSFEFGVNAGVRLMIPDSNHRDFAIVVDARAHKVFGNGPSLLITLGVGLVF